jgi:thiamine transporter ThiT
MVSSIRDIVERLSKEKIVGYFLILWGASFFFNAISGLIYYGTYSGSFSVQIAFSILNDLTYLAIAALLILIGLKVLQIKNI